jgi:pyrroloquinoline quinone biosynthesis protein E
MSETCRTCDEHTKDFGGCRCQSFLLTGDAAATDPVCGKSPDHHLVKNAVADANTAQEHKMRFIPKFKPGAAKADTGAGEEMWFRTDDNSRSFVGIFQNDNACNCRFNKTSKAMGQSVPSMACPWS